MENEDVSTYAYDNESERIPLPALYLGPIIALTTETRDDLGGDALYFQEVLTKLDSHVFEQLLAIGQLPLIGSISEKLLWGHEAH